MTIVLEDHEVQTVLNALDSRAKAHEQAFRQCEGLRQHILAIRDGRVKQAPEQATNAPLSEPTNPPKSR